MCGSVSNDHGEEKEGLQAAEDILSQELLFVVGPKERTVWTLPAKQFSTKGE